MAKIENVDKLVKDLKRLVNEYASGIEYSSDDLLIKWKKRYASAIEHRFANKAKK